jgi:hypothetical protein
MKYLKTFEEISPEYIQSKIAGKPDSPQKDRLQNAANIKIHTRTQEENQKKSQQQEEEMMKNPEYVRRKELREKRNKLASDFRYEKLKLYFAPMNNSKPIILEDQGCFEISCDFLIGDYDSDGYAGYAWHDLGTDSFENTKKEFGPFLGSIELEEGNYGSFNNYKRIEGPEVVINRQRDNKIEFIITKEGIQVFGAGIEKMKTLTGKISTSFEYEEAESFTGLKLVGMDAASKNKLANFIKQYASGATTGNNNLKVNGLQMPVFDKDFTYEKFTPLDLKHNPEIDPNIPTEPEPETVQTTANKDEAPETLGGKVKSFLGFKN